MIHSGFTYKARVHSNNILNIIQHGDVVIGWLGDGRTGIVYSEFRSLKVPKYEVRGTPDCTLLGAVDGVSSDHHVDKTISEDDPATL